MLCSAQSSLPSTTHFTWFLAFLGGGAVFLILAFSLFLPVIILAPSKFAICFTIGSLLIMSAFMSLRGWKGQLAHMFSTERLPFTLGKGPVQIVLLFSRLPCYEHDATWNIL